MSEYWLRARFQQWGGPKRHRYAPRKNPKQGRHFWNMVEAWKKAAQSTKDHSEVLR